LREWVIQEYIDEPLLLKSYDNRKFHLRVYIIVVGKLKVYVYNDILALFSLRPYDEIIQLNDSLPDLDLKTHITNTCFQFDDLNFRDESLKYLESHCVKRFWTIDFDKISEEENMAKRNYIFNQIKECISEIFNCFSNEPTGEQFYFIYKNLKILS
jgi:tubulin--tyrosine ligase